MNKKILIGSIIAVTVLIGVSFTSVIGYRSGASDVKASPLFNIRTSRAIDEESEYLSCEYVGKGEDIALSIPTSDKRQVSFQKVIDRIREMDEATFKRFIGLVINYLHRVKKFRDTNIDDIVNQLKHLNFNNVDLLDDLNNNYDPPTMTPSMYNCCTIYWEDPRDCPISIYSPLNCLFIRLFSSLIFSIIFVILVSQAFLDFFSLLPEC